MTAQNSWRSNDVFDLVEALLADALDQQYFAAFVADPIDQDAAQRRAECGHHGIEQELSGIRVGVAGDNGVERHAEEGRVHGGKSGDTPDAERLQHREDQQGPFVEEMFQGSG